jgi:putative oxidoreductase
MIVAAMTVHWEHGLFAGTNGIEVPLLYSAFAVTLALSGPGRYSLDALLGLQPLWTPVLSWAALAVAVVAALGNLAIRRLPEPSRG